MLQKVMKQGRNGNVSEFRHMTTSFFSTCLSSCSSQTLCKTHFCPITKMFQTYEHLRQLLLNNEPKPYVYMQGFSQREKNEVVRCLNSPTLPFLPCFITFCSTHSYTSYLFMHFFRHYSVIFLCRQWYYI